MNPAYRIIANESDITTKLAERLVSLSVVDSSGYDSDTIELVLADHDADNRITVPPLGAELKVWLGYGLELVDMGLFVVDELELSGYPEQLTIRGRAAPYESSKAGKTDLQTQKTRHWAKGTKLGGLVAKIAKEHNMTASVSSSLSSLVLPQMDQTSESDLSFLVRLARRFDATVKPTAGRIVVIERGRGKSASGADLSGVVVEKKQTTRWSFNNSARDAGGTVVAYYHDLGAAQRKSVTVGSGDPVRKLKNNYQNEATAKKAAQSELAKRGRNGFKINLTIVGNASIRAEVPMVLSGFRVGVPTDWIISRVEHTLSSAGYSCEVSGEQPTS
jgi:phage protein D